MCFSATSSFIASGILAGTGVVALKSTRAKSLRPFASTPLLFAVQQAFEGFVWVTYGGVEGCFLHYFSEHVFLTFAFFIWPIWLPLVLLVAEKGATQRKALRYLTGFGVLLSLLGLYNLIVFQDELTLAEGSLKYGIGYPNSLATHLYLIAYGIVIILPCFMTSLKGCKLFGAGLLLSLVMSYIFMQEAFVSVWCFFAALLSVMIIWIVKKNEL